MKWVADRTQHYLNVERIEVGLEPPSMADNLEKQYLYMQLAAAGEISRTKAFKAIGITDPVAEAKARIDEDLEIEKVKQDKQEEFQRETAAGGGGGDPGQGAGGAPVTPLDRMSQAQQVAQQWLAIQDDGERSKEMQQMESTNPELYALAKQEMEKARNQGSSDGRKSVSQGAQPPSGGAA